jgi:hypothetical protein
MSENFLDAVSQPPPCCVSKKVPNETPHDTYGVLGTTPVRLDIGTSSRWADQLRTFAASPLTNDLLHKGPDGPGRSAGNWDPVA